MQYTNAPRRVPALSLAIAAQAAASPVAGLRPDGGAFVQPAATRRPRAATAPPPAPPAAPAMQRHPHPAHRPRRPRPPWHAGRSRCHYRRRPRCTWRRSRPAPRHRQAPVDNGNGTQTVDNPYGLSALWKSGDAVSRTVLILLAIMSLGTWYIMITKFWEQARVFAAARTANKDFWKTASVREGIARLKPASPFRYIAENGVSATEHHEGALTDAIDLHTWVTMAIQRAQETVSSRLQGGLAFLATVGSVSPFVGLFGTVWGIYHALTAIGAAGQASIDKVAGPVGEALIMTAIGLATAVPAVLGYNFLVRRNKSANEKVRNFGSDLHSILLSGRRVSVAQGASSTPVAAPVAARVA